MLGTTPVISVGDRGKIRLDTMGDLTGAAGFKILIYTLAAWNAAGTPTEIAATAPTPSNGLIEATMTAGLFAASGTYVARACVTWADGDVLGAPVDFFVYRAK